MIKYHFNLSQGKMWNDLKLFFPLEITQNRTALKVILNWLWSFAHNKLLLSVIRQ